jgi:hypothetical protein
MSVRQFLDVVPKPVKIAAAVIAGGGVPIGLVAALMTGHLTRGAFVPLLAPGIGFGLLAGIWVLGLGYVYADARRRAMPPIPWTLIAAFIPNLLGFLLYFALRRPIALPCSHCGQPTTAEQRFCSWCGFQGSSTLSNQPS